VVCRNRGACLPAQPGQAPRQPIRHQGRIDQRCHERPRSQREAGFPRQAQPVERRQAQADQGDQRLPTRHRIGVGGVTKTAEQEVKRSPVVAQVVQPPGGAAEQESGGAQGVAAPGTAGQGAQPHQPGDADGDDDRRVDPPADPRRQAQRRPAPGCVAPFYGDLPAPQQDEAPQQNQLVVAAERGRAVQRAQRRGNRQQQQGHQRHAPAARHRSRQRVGGKQHQQRQRKLHRAHRRHRLPTQGEAARDQQRVQAAHIRLPVEEGGDRLALNDVPRHQADDRLVGVEGHALPGDQPGAQQRGDEQNRQENERGSMAVGQAHGHITRATIRIP